MGEYILDHCFRCGDFIRPVVPGDSYTTSQRDNALQIDLNGGYGMFFDNLYSGGDEEVFGPFGKTIQVRQGMGWDLMQLRLMLCHDCAELLVKFLVPSGEKFSTSGWHSHEWR